MSTGPHKFKQTEASRGFRAARAAGIRNPEVEIDLTTGKMVIRDGDRGKASDSDNANPWDEVLSDDDDPDKKRAS
jgi:hypothetical protein